YACRHISPRNAILAFGRQQEKMAGGIVERHQAGRLVEAIGVDGAGLRAVSYEANKELADLIRDRGRENHIVMQTHWGDFCRAELSKLQEDFERRLRQTPPGAERAKLAEAGVLTQFDLASGNHVMTLRLKVKIENNKTVFSINLYDSNESFTERRWTGFELP